MSATRLDLGGTVVGAVGRVRLELELGAPAPLALRGG